MNVKKIVILFSIFCLTGCLTQEADNYSIVIPPGDQVNFSIDDFVEFSDDNYIVLVRNVGDENHKLETLLDVTPVENQRMASGVVHRQIVPKGGSLEGTLILEVVMDYHRSHFFGFVFDNFSVVKPNIYTTLTYKLLANYPDKPMNTYSKEIIEAITTYIEDFAKQRMDLFKLQVGSVKLDLLLKFIQNGLSSDPEFLTYMKGIGVEFDFNSEGDIVSAPYPFGVINNPPALDQALSTPVGLVAAQENALLEVGSPAFDPDGDIIFYVWEFENQFHSSDTALFTWFPDYFASRPENYALSSLVSDGGKILKSDWDIKVFDANLPPEMDFDCATTVREGEEYRCTLTGTDPNGDELSWVLSNSGFSGTTTIGGQPALTPATGNQVDLVFVPDNADGKRRSATFEIRLLDGKDGVDYVLHVITVEDINVPPVMLGGMTPTNPLHLSPREWDYCLDKDVYGLSSDLVSNGPFTFSVELQDPDNVAGATPPDVVDLRISGLGTENIAQVGDPVIDGVNNKVIYNFEWKPNHDSKVSNITFIMNDDHGGLGTPVTISQTAQDVNQRPCMTSAYAVFDGTYRGYLYKYLHTRSYQRKKAEDFDNDTPIIVTHRFSRHTGNINPHLLEIPFYEWFGEPIVVRQKFGETGYSYQTQASDNHQRYYVYPESKNAGLLEFERSSEGPTDIAISKGYPINLVEASTGHFIEYETSRDIVIGKKDQKVAVPVVAINRDVTLDLLSVIDTSQSGPMTDSTLIATNPAFDGKLGTVTLTRGPGTPDTDVWVDENLILKNAPGQKSMAYKPTGNFFLPSGQNSINFPVIMERRELAAGSTINYVTPDPSITVRLPSPINDHNGYWLRPVKNGYWFRNYVYALDGADTAINEITRIMDMSFPANLQVSNSAGFYDEGEVTFTRPVTDSLTSLLIPQNTEVRTLNDKKFLTTADITLGIGESTKDIAVQRIPDVSPTEPYTLIFHRDWNYRPLQASSNLSFDVQEGSEKLNYVIEVKDGVDPLDPRDPDDTYTFQDVPQTIAPVGALNYCRNPVNTFAESSSCTPCTTPLAADKYHASRFCFLNFKPDPIDTAEFYTLKVEAKDNGYSLPAGSQEFVLSININVLEDNEPPKLTDENGTVITGTGDTIGAPIVVNQDFIEGVPGSFSIYARDEDKSLALKKLDFTIEEVYDASLANQVIAQPDNLSVIILSRDYDVDGVGASATAAVKWQPTDSDIKQYGGTDGLILKVKIFDNIASPTDSLSITKFYQVRLRNTNNIPMFHSVNNTLNPVADTYFTDTITVTDLDEATPLGGVFVTSLNLCQDNLGAEAAHDGKDNLGAQTSPALDTVPLADSTICHATSKLWGHKFTQFDPAYDGNLNVGDCRNDPGGANTLNADLAVPKFTRLGLPYKIGDKIAYDYKIEWCPQIGQIGNSSVDILLTDNGDVDRPGTVLDFKQGSVSLQVNVISPVFFESPKLSLQTIPGSAPPTQGMLPDHFMVQTTARGGDQRFKYPLIINNSKKNDITVTLVDAPRDCALPNGMCLLEEDGQWSLDWTPKFPDDVTLPGDENTWHKIELLVVDDVTSEQDLVYFYLQVAAASANQNTPSIDAFLPASTSLSINELETQSFSLTASDADNFPNPVLHYRWYVDGVLTNDLGNTFDYTPDKLQGGIDVDGAGPLKQGEHVITVEVTDGNFVAQQQWDVKVKNTYLVPVEVFDFVDQRKEADNLTVTDLEWELELPIQQSFPIDGGGQSHINYLVMAGSYKAGVVKKNFMWNLKFFEGEINRDLASSNPWSLYEDLPWRTDEKVERLSYYYSSGQLNYIASSQYSRSGPYSTTQDASKLSGNLSEISAPLAGGFKCTATCARSLYLGEKGYGNRLVESWGNYLFYVDDSNKSLLFDYNGDANVLTVDSFGGFGGDGSDDLIYGLAINDQTKQLYISTKDINNGDSYIHIYNLNILGANNAPSGGLLPTLVTRLSLTLPPPYASAIAGPTEIVVDTDTNTVYSLLAGVGGVVKFVDDGIIVPTLGAGNFIGLIDISASPTDLASSGKKLYFDSDTKLLAGVSREGNQVFTINPESGDKVSVHSYPRAFDTIVHYSTTGLALVVQRSSGKIFELK